MSLGFDTLLRLTPDSFRGEAITRVEEALSSSNNSVEATRTGNSLMIQVYSVCIDTHSETFFS